MATDGYASARLDMLLQHELIVHFCKNRGKQLNEAAALALDDVYILVDGAGDRPIESQSVFERKPAPHWMRGGYRFA
jgi:hypothetical protein